MKKYLIILLLPLLVFTISCEDENNCSNTISNDAKAFADQNWSLQKWYYFTQLIDVEKWSHNGVPITHNMFAHMRKYTGTHFLTLQLSGELLSEIPYNFEYISSDSLHLVAPYLNTSDVQVVKDSNFYKYVGEYNQFVGGRLDARTDWYYEEKDVGDSIEIIIKTPKKQEYLDMLPNCN